MVFIFQNISVKLNAFIDKSLTAGYCDDDPSKARRCDAHPGPHIVVRLSYFTFRFQRGTSGKNLFNVYL